MEYLVVIEKTATGYSGYAPDLPGCFASGASTSEVRSLMR
jgi:predicted RNase H-like HicB family nuclease